MADQETGSVLYDLSVSSSEYAGTYRGVLEVFNNTSGSAANAQDAFNIVYNALKEAGVPLDDLNKKLAQEFPYAAQATKNSVDSIGWKDLFMKRILLLIR